MINIKTWEPKTFVRVGFHIILQSVKNKHKLNGPKKYLKTTTVVLPNRSMTACQLNICERVCSRK